MPRVHLIFGILVFVVFLVTGRLMRWDFPDKEIIDQEFRLLMRSRHIYILLAALIHVVLGLYLTFSKTLWRKIVQYAGSVLLFLGTAVLIGAFFSETYYVKHFTDTSRNGLYLTLWGAIMHVIGGVQFREK